MKTYSFVRVLTLGSFILGSTHFAPVIHAATVTPLVDLTLTTGQSFIDGTASSVAGNADVLVTPVVMFSDQWSLFPTYHGFYQGTQDIQAVASGGGRQFRDSTGHSLLFKSVHQWGAWKLKPSVGGSMEWLRETRDEDWGQGLFDFQKYNGGLEGEYAYSSDVGGRVAYDYYHLTFPNYESLESAQTPTLSRELVGKDVLNNANHMVTAGLWSPLLGNDRVEVSGVYDHRSYDDQYRVDEAGQLEPTKRNDTIASLDTVWASPLPSFWGVRWRSDLAFRFGVLDSNQNHYDVNKGKFEKNYYDYTEWRVAPWISAGLAQDRWRVSLGGNYERRIYTDRPAKDVDGNDLSNKLVMDTLITRLVIAHPLSPNASLRLEGSLGWTHANTDYEKIFRYNYRVASYGIGFSYEY